MNREDRMWEILLDSQSTCNVVINPRMLTNVRACEWTLRLQTQVGEFRINQVGDMWPVGTVWFYPKEVANILLQHIMALHSEWDIDYSTKLFRQSGDAEDLSYEVVTVEGFYCKFKPTLKGLQDK